MTLTVVLGVPQLASAQSLPDPLQTKWWVIDLGLPYGCEPGGAFLDGRATSVNDCGEVVGHVEKNHSDSACAYQPFFWQLCGTHGAPPSRSAERLRDLVPTSIASQRAEAHAINNDAIVAGSLRPSGLGHSRPFWWDLLSLTAVDAQPPCDHGTVDADYFATEEGEAFAISNSAARVAVGQRFLVMGTVNLAWEGVAATPPGTATLPNSGSLSDPYYGSAARGVDEIGLGVERAVGEVNSAFGVAQPAYWDTGASVATLLGLPFGSAIGARGFAVNASGDVVGETVPGFPGGTLSAMAWEAPTLTALDLGAVYSASTRTRALSISPRGSHAGVTAVGEAVDLARAIVWWQSDRPAGPHPWTAIDINTATLRPAPDPSFPPANCVPGGPQCAWEITTLHDVNRLGWMAGRGRIDCCDAPFRAVLLVPSPCQADLNGDNEVDAADLTMLLSAWGACPALPCAADITGDDTVNAADLSALLSQWKASCTLDAVCAQLSAAEPAVCSRASFEPAARAVSDPALLAALASIGFGSIDDCCGWIEELEDSSAQAVCAELLSRIEHFQGHAEGEGGQP